MPRVSACAAPKERSTRQGVGSAPQLSRCALQCVRGLANSSGGARGRCQVCDANAPPPTPHTYYPYYKSHSSASRRQANRCCAARRRVLQCLCAAGAPSLQAAARARPSRDSATTAGGPRRPSQGPPCCAPCAALGRQPRGLGGCCTPASGPARRGAVQRRTGLRASFAYLRCCCCCAAKRCAACCCARTGRRMSVVAGSSGKDCGRAGGHAGGGGGHAAWRMWTFIRMQQTVRLR